MKFFTFALRRTLRSVFFLVMLLVLAVTVCAAAALGEQVAEPICLVVDEDGTEVSARVYAALLQDGFTAAESREEVYDAVRNGRADSAVILLDGLEENVLTCDMNSSALLISSPTSVFATMFSGVAATEFFLEQAPFLTETVLAEMGFENTLETIRLHYNEYFEAGLRFTFEKETLSGVVAEKTDYALPFVTGAAAVLLFAALFFGVCDTVRGDLESFIPSLGLDKSFKCVVAPGIAAQMLCSAAAVAIGLLASQLLFGGNVAKTLALPVAVYILLLPSGAMLLALLMPRGRNVKTVLPLWILASLALCPIYLDFADIIPAVSAVRFILPPCWLFWIKDGPLPWLVAAVLLLPVMGFALRLKYKKIYNYK